MSGRVPGREQRVARARFAGRRRAPRPDRSARGDRGRPEPARVADRGGARPAAQGGRRRLRAGPRAAAALGQGRPPAREAGAGRPRRGGARRDRHPRAAREAGVHDAERLPARRRSSRSRSTTSPSSASSSSRSTATSASSSTRACTRSTTSSARRAATSTSRSAPESADLRGRVALLTGGRVKIGYQAGIKLLRAGAQLIVTTRFPRDSAAALRARARLRRLGRPARDLRPRPAPHAERRGVLHAPARRRATGSTSSSTTPARPCAGRPTSTAT